MKEFYRINISGLDRDLPICPLPNGQKIAAFVIFGDPELTVASAADLLAKAPEYDVIVTAESKGIPTAAEMARQHGDKTYVVARKAPKLYMKNVVKVDVTSITTAKQQALYIDQSDIDKMKGKKVLIVDDVISTGESLNAVVQLVHAAGGNIVGQMAILVEGAARDRDDIISLGYIPLFDSEGEPIK